MHVIIGNENLNVFPPCSGADDPAFYNELRFPTLISFTLASIGAYGHAVEALTNMYQWRNIAVLSDKLSQSADLRSRIRAECGGATATFRARAVFYNVLDIPIDSTIGQVRSGLEKARNHSRSKNPCQF